MGCSRERSPAWLRHPRGKLGKGGLQEIFFLYLAYVFHQDLWAFSPDEVSRGVAGEGILRRRWIEQWSPSTRCMAGLGPKLQL